MTGAVPPPLRQRGRCMSDLGVGSHPVPGCLPATVLCAGIQSDGVAAEFVPGSLRQAPGGFPPASPGATPHDADPKPRSWAGGCPQGRAPPRRPHSSPTRRRTSPHARRHAPRSVLCGRSYTLMHAEELRAGHCPLTKSANAPCVHDVVRFVNPPPVRPERTGVGCHAGRQR